MGHMVIQHDVQVLTPGLQRGIAWLFYRTLCELNVTEDVGRMAVVLSALGHRASVITAVLDDVIVLLRTCGC